MKKTDPTMPVVSVAFVVNIVFRTMNKGRKVPVKSRYQASSAKTANPAVAKHGR